MEMHLGWPVVTAVNCFDTIRECGIKPWPKIAQEVSLIPYLASVNEGQRNAFDRFGPKTSVVFHQNPHTGDPFDGFRTFFKDYACVFALIKGMVPVTAEWKHGNDRITLVPVCGVPGKAEAGIIDKVEMMQAVAMREWEEETGFKLKNATLLSPPSGVWAIVRNAHVSCFPFLGEVDMDVPKGKTKFDDTEHLQMVLFPLLEWLKLIEDPTVFEGEPDFCLEACARDITYAALRKQGRLQLV